MVGEAGYLDFGDECCFVAKMVYWAAPDEVPHYLPTGDWQGSVNAMQASEDAAIAAFEVNPKAGKPLVPWGADA